MEPFESAVRIALSEYQDLLDDRALARLCSHWRLVSQWGTRLNLTAVRDPAEAAWRHYRDSVEPLRVIRGHRVVDMGSGAGYPGVPLAVLNPALEVTLVEPRRKRVSFLKTVTAELALENVQVVEGRSTDVANSQFDAVVTRATFSSATDLRLLLKWCTPSGHVIALRTDASGAPGSRVYSYDVNGQRRVMEVWTSD